MIEMMIIRYFLIITFVSITLTIIGDATESFALKFEDVKQKYLSLINATELNTIITNSSEFKAKTQEYHYNFATSIAKLGYHENNSYAFKSVDVVYSLYLHNEIPWDKTLIVTMDPNLKIHTMVEYTPWHVPLGYPLPIVPSHPSLSNNYSVNIDINKLVNVMPPSPLEQIRHGVEANAVACFQGMSSLELVFKAVDNSPACVQDDTAQKLIERGWAKPVQS